MSNSGETAYQIRPCLWGGKILEIGSLEACVRRRRRIRDGQNQEQCKKGSQNSNTDMVP